MHNNIVMPSVPMKIDEGGPIPAEWKLSCLQCGYDLTGLPNRTCPECGTLFSPRHTWEGNRAGVVPREKVAPTQITRLLVVGGIVAAVLLLGQLTQPQHPAASITAAVVIILAEVWIYFSSVRPVLARTFAAGICIIILMFIVL